jgi:hypothetical protein
MEPAIPYHSRTKENRKQAAKCDGAASASAYNDHYEFLHALKKQIFSKTTRFSCGELN